MPCMARFASLIHAKCTGPRMYPSVLPDLLAASPPALATRCPQGLKSVHGTNLPFLPAWRKPSHSSSLSLCHFYFHFISIFCIKLRHVCTHPLHSLLTPSSPPPNGTSQCGLASLLTCSLAVVHGPFSGISKDNTMCKSCPCAGRQQTCVAVRHSGPPVPLP